MSQHMAQKAHHIATVIGVFLDLQQQLTAGCDRANRRQVIVTTRRTQDGWLADWRPSAHQCWQQVKASFIYPDERAALAFGFFLSAGHFSLRQRSMAASLRSLARSIGFWALQPMARRRRP